MPESTPIIGRVLSRYRILEEVGRGGMATVYRALDPSLGREVAVKVLHPHLADESESRIRLEREAQAVAKLHHDNILEIHDYSGQSEQETFIVAEFIRGPTLTAFLGTHPLVIPDVAAMIVHELAAALGSAHAAGIIHRDIKPENVMIRQSDGRIKLTDFGIAQIIDKERLTATGQLIGSPAYLAPELVEGGRVDFRTDVFSLGIVLYRAATGQLPFQGRNPHEMMKRIVEGRYPPPDQVVPAVGRGLARIIARALAARPDDRYPDMKSLERDLEADLTVAGLGDIREELRRFFADPDAWEAEARPRITAALVASARQEIDRKKSAAALALTTRALALSPDDAAARALLDHLGRIGRMRRLGALALGGTAALLCVGGGWIAIERRATHRSEVVGPAPLEQEPANASEPAQSTQPDPAPRDVSPARPLHPTTAEPRLRPATVAALHPRAPAFREVVVNVARQKNVEILIDNVTIGAWQPGVPIKVPAGPHSLTFRNPFCYPITVPLGDNQTALPQIRMRWKEAYLRVVTSPDGAQVEIAPEHGQRHFVRGGDQLPIPISDRSEDGRERVRIEAGEAGYKTSERTIEVLAGTTHPETIELQKLP